MLISIEKIYESGIQGPIVKFNTIYGEGKGVWCGKSPADYAEYAVEFNINEPFHFGSEIQTTEENTPKIWIEDEKTCIQGYLICHNDLNISTLQVGDYIVDVETIGTVPSIGTFCYMKVSIFALEIFDYSL